MGAAYRFRFGFGHAQVTHFSGLNQIFHRPNRFFYRHAQVDTMLIIKVNMVNAETPERLIARLLHVFRPSTDAPGIRVFQGAHDSELRR